MAKRKRRKRTSGRGSDTKPPAAPKKRTRAEKRAAQAETRPQGEAASETPEPGPGSPSDGGARKIWPDAVAWACFGLVGLFFLVLKSYSAHWQVGDENVYLYMAWAGLDHGALPYRDFFFAHPPLHLLPGLPVHGLLGFTPAAARVIPVGASLISALAVFLTARRHIGRVGAVAAVFALLTAFSLLRASSHWTGINLALMWTSLGLMFALRRKPVTAGVMFALGVCTGNYVLPGAVMGGLLAFLGSRRDGLRYSLGFAAPWAAIQVIGLLLGGGGYVDGVYRYHFLKSSKEGASRQMFYRVATDNFLLHLSGVLAPVLAWLERRLAPGSGASVPERGRPERDAQGWIQPAWLWFRGVLLQDGPRGVARIGSLWALGYLLFIFTIPRVFPFYFLLAFPGLALATGALVDGLARHGIGLARRLYERDRPWRIAAAWVAGLLVFILVATLVRVPLQRGLLPTYIRPRPVPMTWRASALPVDGLLRWCCWDDTAQARTAYGTVQEVLYHESRIFEQAEALAAWLEERARPGDTLFGDSSTAGLIALLSGVPLQADFADTNTLRFTSGISPPQEVIERLDTPALRFVLVQGRAVKDRRGRIRWRYRKFAALPAFRRWLDENFRIAHRVVDRTKGTFLILERTGSGPPGSS